MFGIGLSELLMLALIGLLFFGANKLPEIGKNIGDALRELKNAPAEPEKANKKESA